MAKRFMAVLLMILFMSTLYTEANAEVDNTEYMLLCNSGVCITSDAAVMENEYKSIGNDRFVTAKNSYAVLIGAGIIDIAPETRMNIDETILLEEGAVGIQSEAEETMLSTGTEQAYVSAYGKALIKVDDYGNTFNYCINGELKLISTENNKSVILNEGEYVAVTVKRAIRDVRAFEQSEADKLSVRFTELKNGLPSTAKAASMLAVEEYDFNADGAVCKMNANTVRKFINASDNEVSRLLRFGGNDCNFEIYNSKMELIGEGASGGKVHIVSSAGSEFYVYMYADTDEMYTLYNDRYISVYERAFGILKELALPAVAALAVLVVYTLIRERRKNTSKPKY